MEKHLSHLSKFSKFISLYYPLVELESLNREIIVDFIDFLNQDKLNIETKNKHLATLRLFFEAGNINSWFNVPDYLIRKEDFGKVSKPNPRYIPEEVMQQLNQNLDKLPIPVRQMVLILQETGLRIGELLQ